MLSAITQQPPCFVLPLNKELSISCNALPCPQHSWETRVQETEVLGLSPGALTGLLLVEGLWQCGNFLGPWWPLPLLTLSSGSERNLRGPECGRGGLGVAWERYILTRLPLTICQASGSLLYPSPHPGGH